jgi:hypothetical protein
MLVIHPAECIDWSVSEPECPVDAIKADTEPGLEKWLPRTRKSGQILRRPHGSQQGYEHDVPRTLRFRSGACGVCQGSQGQVARRASDPSSCRARGVGRAGLPRATHARDGDSRARRSRPAWRVFRRRRRRLTFPELHIPGPAAQTRMVSMAEIRLGSGNPRELSKA